MAVSVDSTTQQSEIRTACAGPQITDAELRTAVNSTLRSRGKASTRTALSTATAIPSGVSYDKMVSAFTTITFSYILLAITTYVQATVSLFHVAYFSYRNPTVSKDLIKTAAHLLKTSYDNKLLTGTEIVEVTHNSIIAPMVRHNQKYHQEENQRTAQLQTMRTSTAVSQ
ncbi:Protein CBG00302 [Caenorhabditis briggsae]|uniref:Uncharacterized protein n=2 Tax=Caenorhabditis briggsae TaxID=6238 RepID=A0AAE9DQB5_CAEBR|nr:Protein CBG00302 [Caenorhabditis briggsae]ULU09231.1 hypothetical protein L3Y34_013974 [Caenorhabditis briggsae]CAP21737.1 Protein CBG00302 [Caenorhabditis briggsae]